LLPKDQVYKEVIWELLVLELKEII
jgi:hypothetical protein